MKNLYRSKFMVKHFQARNTFLVESFLIFSYLENLRFTRIWAMLIVGSVGCRSSSGGRSILRTLVGFLFTPYNNLLKMKGFPISNKIH
jgi:hypothetical protein